MNNLRCKGGQPASITIKVKSENPILNSLDPQKHETKLQKEIMSQSKQAIDQQKKDASQADKQEDDEEEDDEAELQRIEGISTPKHKIVYSYPVDLMDCWTPPADVLQDRKFPISIRVTIQTPFIDSIKNADLDINEETLLFKVPDIYDLMINFKYKVNPDKGNAKFEKDKKRLLIDLPITGVTEATHQSMRKEKEEFDRKMKRITGGLVQDIDSYTQDVKTFEGDIDLEKDEPQPDLQQLKEEALKEPVQEQEEEKQFLKFYDESKVEHAETPIEAIVLNEVKFKEENESILLPETVIDPVNNKPTLVSEIMSDDYIKGAPTLKTIEPMFQQQNELLFFMFNIPSYDEKNLKYFVYETHLYFEYTESNTITQ